MDQVNFCLWCLYAGLGLLLKRMDNPKLVVQLHHIYNAKRIAARFEHNLVNAAAKTFQWLGIIWLSTSRSHRKGELRINSGLCRKGLKIPPRCFHP